MGFIYRKRYDLKFGADALDALEVSMRDPDIDTLLEIRRVTGPEKVTREVANASLLRACEIIAEHLIEWNLEKEVKNEDGTLSVIPIPATLEGVRAQPRGLLSAIMQEWQDGIEGVSAPLDKPSPSGGMLAVVNIPMEPLSANLPS